MMKPAPTLWFSIHDFNDRYPGTEPSFIEPSSFAWSKDLAAQVHLIKQELGAYLQKHQLDGYFNKAMVNNRNSWKTIALKTWSVELFRNQKAFPQTTALLNKYPEIVSASFNLLEPGAHILPHSGDTNAIFRCHLGLDIPAGLPACGFRVRDEKRAWENGQWLIFIDAHDHEAWNDSPNPRYIFLLDVMRDEFKAKQTFVCSTVLTSLFLQKRAQTFKFLQKAKPATVRFLSATLRPFAAAALWFSNTLKLF
ncbi:MAG: aspartyl/asparaginyl beta-hydroxylase domain-containing protein [Bacteroidetes bacterium]|nr:aspartyl/asparaginyl beta-hydroxylase domain-containing protein [Bacteroidota bacterium]